MAQSRFTDPDVQQRLAAVALGLEVEEFLRSNIGRYLMGRAEMEEADAVEEYKQADPDDLKLMRAIQRRIDIPKRLKQWLEEAVQGGRNAEEQQRQIDDHGDGT